MKWAFAITIYILAFGKLFGQNQQNNQFNQQFLQQDDVQSNLDNNFSNQNQNQNQNQQNFNQDQNNANQQQVQISEEQENQISNQNDNESSDIRNNIDNIDSTDNATIRSRPIDPNLVDDVSQSLKNNGTNSQTNEPQSTNQIEQGNEPSPEESETLVEEETVTPEFKVILEPNQFSGAPAVPGTLGILAGGEAPEDYLVRPGDTLFDICDQLLDEPGYWPKLWALNPDIKNPHFIFPGMRLRFYPGDRETPPYLQIVTEDDIVPIETGNLDESELVKEDVSALLLDLASEDSNQVIGADEVPEFPELQGNIEVVGGRYDASFLQVLIPGFIFEDEKEEIGVIVAGASGSLLIDKGEDVIIEIEEESLTAGRTYTVLRIGEDIYRDDGDYVGVRHDFVGQIRITNKVDEDYAVGKVLANRIGVMPGDIIVPYISTKRQVPLKVRAGTKGDGKNSVVGFEYPYKVIGGRGSFVFIDKLSGDIPTKTTFVLYQNIGKVSSSFVDELPSQSKKNALIYIIDNSGTAAVGYVVNNKSEIRVGDTFGPG